MARGMRDGARGGEAGIECCSTPTLARHLHLHSRDDAQRCTLSRPNRHSIDRAFNSFSGREQRRTRVRSSVYLLIRPLLWPDFRFLPALSPSRSGQGLFARVLTTRRPCYSCAPGTKSALLRNSRNGASVLVFERFPFHDICSAEGDFLSFNVINNLHNKV